MNGKLWLAAVSLVFIPAAGAEQHAIDASKSRITIHAFKSGVFSALGHDHDISAPISTGNVDATARHVEFRIKSSALRVLDPKASEKDRAEIQKTMLGPEVLDSEKYPEIVFRSTGAESAGADSWTVRGTLTLHGQSRPVTVQVRHQDGRYAGSARLKQTDFGITPVKVAGGTIRVKDEVRIEFEIQLAR